MSGASRQSAIVTGATGGLGRCICLALAEAGWDVGVGWRGSAERADALLREIAARGAKAFALRLDMADPAGIASAIDVEPPSPVEALVVNASPVPLVAPFGRIGQDELLNQLQVNALGPYELIRTVWKRHFQSRRKGHLVAVSSVAVEHPVATRMAGYVIGKSALESLAQSAGAEYGPAGLATTIVRPGYMDTPMLQAFDARFIEMMREKGQVGRPEETAAAIVDVVRQPSPGGSCVVRKV